MTITPRAPRLVLAGDRSSTSRLLREAARWAEPVGILARTPGEGRDAAAAVPGAARLLESPGEIRGARVVLLAGPGDGETVAFAGGLRLHDTGAVVIVGGVHSSRLAGEVQRVCGVPPHRLLAAGSLPDQLRLEREIARWAGVSRCQVRAPVIGRPDGSFMPLRRYLRVAGVPLDCIGGRSAPVPAAGRPTGAAELWSRAAILVARSVLWDRRAVLSCAAFHPAGSGLPEGFYSLPSVIGGRGLVARLGLTLTLEERAFLNRGGEGSEAQPTSYA